MSDAAGLDCSEGNGAETSAKTIDDADRSEGLEGKVNITTPNKTNKILILVSYKLNIRLFIKTHNTDRKTSKSIVLKQVWKRNERRDER